MSYAAETEERALKYMRLSGVALRRTWGFDEMPTNTAMSVLERQQTRY